MSPSALGGDPREPRATSRSVESPSRPSRAPRTSRSSFPFTASVSSTTRALMPSSSCTSRWRYSAMPARPFRGLCRPFARSAMASWRPGRSRTDFSSRATWTCTPRCIEEPDTRCAARASSSSRQAFPASPRRTSWTASVPSDTRSRSTRAAHSRSTARFSRVFLGEPVADSDLTEYARDLQQSVLLDAGIEGAEQMRSEVFTRHVIDILIEAGELENALPCHLRERGIEVHGYGIDDEDTLNLLTTIYTGDVPPGSVSRTELDKALQRLINFWDRCREQPYHERLEESSDAYDMALHIHRCAGTIRRVRLFVLTDGRAAAAQLSTEDADGIELRRSVWDIVRLPGLETSGQPQEPIEINFVQRYGEPLACLSVGRGIAAYDAMLTVFPGAWLAEIYNEYGPRLLELNVRSFLQAAGKVKRGIRDRSGEQ